MSEKHFDRREAEELLPMIGQFLEEARKQKRAMDSIAEELSLATARIMMLGGSFPPFAELNHKKSRCEKIAAQLSEMIEEIQQTGCVLKDIETGLVDFPSLRNGEEVYLCWKLGEEHIEFWHGIEEGFAGRKPLDDSPSKDTPPKSSRFQ